MTSSDSTEAQEYILMTLRAMMVVVMKVMMVKHGCGYFAALTVRLPKPEPRSQKL